MNRWLKLPLGEISTNILRMLPESLSLSFELMAQKAFGSGKPIKLKNITPEGDMEPVYGENKSLDVTIVKLPNKNGYDLLAATFQSREKSKSVSPDNEIDLNLASREKIDILERELRINRENLQTTIEELESSNEELQAANEELQSSNEELESVNEELYTVNAEFQEKVVELTESNNDLDNLIRSTNIAILFLDENLHVRKFTPAIRSILKINSHDVGQHISHFRNAFPLENLMTEIEQVYSDLAPFEKTITNQDGNEFIMRITPFRSAKREIQGVVLSFIEITAINKAQRKLELSNDALDKIHAKYDRQSELFELIAHNAHDMITVHDLKGKAEYVSPAAFEVTGYSPDEVDDENLIEHIPLKNHKKQWKTAFAKVVSGNNVAPVNYKFQTKSDGLKWFETSIKPIKSEKYDVTKILATTRDISRRRFYQDELQKLSLIATQTNNGVIITDVKGRITFVNNAFERLTGYNEKDVLGKKPGDFLQGENSDSKAIELMSKRIKARNGFSVEILNYTKTGEKILVKIDCEPMRNTEGKVTGFFSMQYEISKQKEYEAQIAALNDLLKEQNKSLEQMNRSLEEFAYVASHDLKAPARNVLGMIELIRKKGPDIDPEKYDQYI
ncbi:MAG: PAS domain S-box protein, partial [Flavobacteriales bacterium]|nr:PAS domain S-box protein [Flavobacteriales bacterium]